ncbi:MAG: multiheme c-type cytochrome [Deltaproteobacteria bacterium]|nr:multiheme c-type cytochrome [Deltaproteobacteria bacterium]
MLGPLPAGAAEKNRAAPKNQGPTLTVLAAGDMRGELKPCGCSQEGQMGGLPRRLSYLEKNLPAESRDTLLVDLGNNYPQPSAQGELKVELIRRLLVHFPPQGLLPGPNELATGMESLGGELPYLLSNAAAGSPWPISRAAKRGGRTVGMFGFLSPESVYQGPATALKLLPAGPELRARLAAEISRDGYDPNVLLFRGSDAELEQISSWGLFSLIITGNPSADELKQITERKTGSGVFPQVPTKGQGLLRIALQPSGAPAPAWKVDWLNESYPDHPQANIAMAEYDEQVKGLFFTRLSTIKRTQMESPFAGATTCAACHFLENDLWKKSRHAGAYGTLERVGKQFDPECLACHVVGLGKDGYLSQDITPALAGVQCENCHGPAKVHSVQPLMRTGKTGPPPASPPDPPPPRPPPPGDRECRVCHVGSHSPKFIYEVYWPKIIHGKERRPLNTAGN